MEKKSREGESRIFAMKVINKERLLAKDIFLINQIINEIQVQRLLNDCGNSLKLIRIYESDSYLNFLLEY